jgi:hypothetical protein
VDPAEMAVDDIRQELSSIVASLAEAAAEDLTTRATLRSRQQHLRAEMARRAESLDDATSLRRELKGVRRRLNQVVEDRPNIAAMNDGGEGGAGLAEAQEMGWRYDEGNDLGPLRRRAWNLERRIAAVEAEPSPGQ